MSFSKFKIPSSGTLVALLGLAVCPVALHATNRLTVTPLAPTTPYALTCGAAPGNSATISVKAAVAPTGSNTIVVTYVAPTGMTVAPASGTQTITIANVPVTYTLSATTGCAGLVAG